MSLKRSRSSKSELPAYLPKSKACAVSLKNSRNNSNEWHAHLARELTGGTPVPHQNHMEDSPDEENRKCSAACFSSVRPVGMSFRCARIRGPQDGKKGPAILPRHRNHRRY